MNAKFASVALAAALLASASAAFAGGQAFGRDSVYATPGSSVPSAKSSAPVVTVKRDGRGSVYAQDLPAPTPKDQVRVVGTVKPGRA